MSTEKLSLNGAWSMAVGGMVGGGIFSALGVVIGIAGQWAWLSFVLAGAIALLTGHSYVALARHFGEGGGAYSWLRRLGHGHGAGVLAWLLILGYVLTMAVYGFTFGHYVGHVLGGGALAARGAALVVIAGLVGVNLMGVGEANIVEIVTVWGKMAVLALLALAGLWHWAPDQLVVGVDPRPIHAALTGGAAVFMAYEGFQLLAYDYDDIENPGRNLGRAVMWAILAVIVTYVAVALGVSMLIGAAEVVAQKEISLAVAGQALAGGAGLWIVTVAAAFSTGSAINATLFATARLCRTVAEAGDLPAIAAHENRAGIPDRAVLVLGAGSAVLAMSGSLNELVEAASLTFLFTFTVVNWMAWRVLPGHGRWPSLAGALGALLAIGLLTFQLVETDPPALITLGLATVLAVGGRVWMGWRGQAPDAAQ